MHKFGAKNGVKNIPKNQIWEKYGPKNGGKYGSKCANFISKKNIFFTIQKISFKII